MTKKGRALGVAHADLYIDLLALISRCCSTKKSKYDQCERWHNCPRHDECKQELSYRSEATQRRGKEGRKHPYILAYPGALERGQEKIPQFLVANEPT